MYIDKRMGRVPHVILFIMAVHILVETVDTVPELQYVDGLLSRYRQIL